MALSSLSAVLFLQVAAITAPQGVADPLVEPWRWTSYPALAGEQVRAIAETPDGTAYVGTRGGVWRSDGVAWSHYDLSRLDGSPVHALAVADDGGVWAGTDRGVLRFDRTADEWQPIYPESNGAPFPVRDLLPDPDGSVWVAGPWGLLRLGDDRRLFTSASLARGWRAVAPDIPVQELPAGLTPERPWRDGTGMLVVGAVDARVGGQPLPLVVASVAADGPAARSGLTPGMSLLPADPSGGWGELAVNAGARSVNGFALDAGGREVVITGASTPGGYTDFRLWDLARTPDGAMWIGLRMGEVVRLPASEDGSPDPLAGSLFGRSDGISVDQEPRIGVGPEGAVWVVSENGGGGVSRLTPDGWKSMLLSSIGGNDVNPSIAVGGENRVWIGGLGVLHRFEEGTWTVYRRPEVPVPSTRTLVHLFGDRLWLTGAGAEIASIDVGVDRFETLPGLAFQGERGEGAGREEWFIAEDGTVRVRSGLAWTTYGVADGLMPSPVALLVEDDEVWAGGAREQVAATARFDGSRWQLEEHPALSWSTDRRGMYRSRSGDLWVAGAVSPIAERGQIGGVLQRSEGQWIHHPVPVSAYGIADGPDGDVWAGGPSGLYRHAREGWTVVGTPWDSLDVRIDALGSDSAGSLWAGTRAVGVLRYDGDEWVRYGPDEGLSNGDIESLVVRAPDDVWALTPDGARRFDGTAWYETALEGTPLPGAFGQLRASADGSIWQVSTTPADGPGLELSRFSPPQSVRTVRVVPEYDAPVTSIETPPERIASSGAFSLRWEGTDGREGTPAAALTYSVRIDDGSWSAYSGETSFDLAGLPSGDHRVEVRARDRDRNVELVPAGVGFRITPPVWAQLWFQLLVGGLTILVGIQTLRARNRGRALRGANTALEERVEARTRDLSEAYAELSRESAERHRAEEQLRQALKMEAVGRLAAGVAHDFNNLLTVVLATTEMLIEDRGEEEELRHDLEDIGGAAGRAAALTQQLLAFSRKQVLMPETLDLDDVVEQLHSILARMMSVDVELLVETEGPALAWADRGGVEQVLLNLVVNAQEAIEGSGRIHVRTDTRELDEGEARALDEDLLPGSYAALTVSDTGHGIRDEDVDDLFEPFFTTKDGGTGLGLATVWGIVKQSGGTILVDSEPGRGTDMTVYIPSDPTIEV